MSSRIGLAGFCVTLALLPGLAGRGETPAVRCPGSAKAHHDPGLVYLSIPYRPHDAWRWVLRPGTDGPQPKRRVEVASLDAPRLREYVGTLPAGSTLGLMWQFKTSDLAHQAGLAELQRLCARRGVRLQKMCFGGA